MLLPFACPRCKADKWLIRYNSDEKFHNIECVGCGYEKILEEVFGPKRKTNVQKKRKDKQGEQVQDLDVATQIQ